MSPAIRAQITRELGVEPVLINSALVSAQNRQRLYWVGKRNPDGTYSQLPISQPEDRGILLRDILESGICWREKAYTLRAATGAGPASTIKTIKEPGKFPFNGVAEPVSVSYQVLGRQRQPDGSWVRVPEAREDGKAAALTTVEARRMVAVPLNTTAEGKAQCLRASCYKDGIRNMVGNTVDRRTCVAVPLGITEDGKAYCLRAQYFKSSAVNALDGGHFPAPMAAEPVRIGTIESDTAHPENDSQQYRVYSPDGKSVTLCGQGGGMGAKTGLYACPCPCAGCPSLCVPEATAKGYVEIAPGGCVDLTQPNSKTRRGRAMTEKSNCLMTSCQYYQYLGTLDKPIYEVKDGQITIGGKQYPVKLLDGYYIIRKLTVRECMRLQTVPEGYTFPVSDTQAYKMLGNGWTVEVIAHIMGHIPGIQICPVDVLSMYDGMSCGHLALDRLGAFVRSYYSTEIDKYAIKTTQANYPGTVQLGDAFQVREPSWEFWRIIQC